MTAVLRESLWQIVCVYDVHAKLVDMLEELHKDTQAVVMCMWVDLCLSGLMCGVAGGRAT